MLPEGACCLCCLRLELSASFLETEAPRGIRKKSVWTKTLIFQHCPRKVREGRATTETLDHLILSFLHKEPAKFAAPKRDVFGSQQALRVTRQASKEVRKCTTPLQARIGVLPLPEIKN